MSPRAVCRSDSAFARKAGIAVLVCGLINISVPTFADDGSSRAAAIVARPGTADAAAQPAPLLQPAPVQRAVAQASAVEARRLASNTQAGGTDTSHHWCAGGLALLGAGVAAAAVSWAQRDPNPQKPNPPVGFVLGTAAGVVGAITAVKSCRH
jgi:hypothetical protein